MRIFGEAALDEVPETGSAPKQNRICQSSSLELRIRSAMDTEAIQGSYGRCLREKGFITRFYELLQARDPRIVQIQAHQLDPAEQSAAAWHLCTPSLVL